MNNPSHFVLKKKSQIINGQCGSYLNCAVSSDTFGYYWISDGNFPSIIFI